VDVFIELSNGSVKRDIRSLLHWKQVLRKNAASSAKQLTAQVLCTSAALMCEHILPAFCAHHLSLFLFFKCKAIVGTSAVHKCCAHARTYTACLFAHIIFLSFIFSHFTFFMFILL
jgi:hypothetical protein